MWLGYLGRPARPAGGLRTRFCNGQLIVRTVTFAAGSSSTCERAHPKRRKAVGSSIWVQILTRTATLIKPNPDSTPNPNLILGPRHTTHRHPHERREHTPRRPLSRTGRGSRLGMRTVHALSGTVRHPTPREGARAQSQRAGADLGKAARAGRACATSAAAPRSDARAGLLSGGAGRGCGPSAALYAGREARPAASSFTCTPCACG